jgi:hypothetical protein
MDEKKEEDKIVPLDKIADKLPDYEEKKEIYKLRHYLMYHVVRKKKVKKGITIVNGSSTVSFD